MLFFRFLLAASLTVPGLLAQDVSESNSSSTVCTFEDGAEVSLQYPSSLLAKKDKLKMGELWPSDKPSFFLFSSADLVAGNSEIPAGAYSVFFRPDKDNWTLVVNKNVAKDAAYDEKSNLARLTMPTGQITQNTDAVKVVFVHSGPKQCNLRINHTKTGAFAEFNQK